MPALAAKKPKVLVLEPQTRERLAESDDVMHGFEIVAGVHRAKDSVDVFIVVSASTLSKYFPVIAKAVNKFGKWLRVLFIKQDIETNALIDKICNTELRKLHHKIFVYRELNELRRILRAWALGDQRKNVAAAWTDDDGSKLVVLDCALDRFEIGFDEIKALERIPLIDRSKVEVHPFGYHLEWPEHDVQIDILETYKRLRDPEYLAKKKLQAAATNKRYGQAVQAIRQKHHLTQMDIKNKVSISEKTVGRIERGEAPPTLKTIEKLANAHGMSSNEYMNAIADFLAAGKSSGD